MLTALQYRYRCTVPCTKRRKTTNPLAAAVKLIASPYDHMHEKCTWSFEDRVGVSVCLMWFCLCLTDIKLLTPSLTSFFLIILMCMKGRIFADPEDDMKK